MFGKTFILFSPFSGTLVDAGGSPVPGIRIERTWHWTWTSTRGADQRTTDAEGRFSFPRVEARSITASFLPHEPVIDQRITAHLPNGPVLLWGYFKHNYEENGELAGRVLNVRCGTVSAPPGGEPLYNGTCIEAR